MAFCTKCGSAQNGDDLFCSGCGNRFGPSAPDTSTVEQEVEPLTPLNSAIEVLKSRDESATVPSAAHEPPPTPTFKMCLNGHENAVDIKFCQLCQLPMLLPGRRPPQSELRLNQGGSDEEKGQALDRRFTEQEHLARIAECKRRFIALGYNPDDLTYEGQIEGEWVINKVLLRTQGDIESAFRALDFAIDSRCDWPHGVVALLGAKWDPIGAWNASVDYAPQVLGGKWPSPDPEMSSHISKPKKVARPNSIGTRIVNAAQASQPKGINCQQCGSVGTVTANEMKKKSGISGGKATAAVLTGGFSILATGLSRKDKVTQMHCSACGVTWLA